MVSVPEQVEQSDGLLQSRGSGSGPRSPSWSPTCRQPIEIVGRFLALLELYRARAVAFDQSEPLGVLQISWTGERPTHQHLAVEEDHYDG
jgi:segregation and condensation protein A